MRTNANDAMQNEPLNAPLRIVGGQLVEARRAAIAGQASAPHRLEPVAHVADVLYVNDSRATFLDATLASIDALDRPIVWVAGAWNADMDAAQVKQLLEERVHATVLFGPQPEEVLALVPERLLHADDLRTAIFLARELARPGDVVLFSPACPSGNGFANYEERGAEFKRAVRDL